MTFLDDVVLRDGAIFIADSHFKRGDSRFLDFMTKIPKLSSVSGKRQIFLMGDIFHLLIGSVDSSLKENAKLLSVLENLSRTHEIFYLEGNHDFGLGKIGDSRAVKKKGFMWADTKCGRRFYSLREWQVSDGQDFKNKYVSKGYYESKPIRIFSYSAQPLVMKNEHGDYCILAHGDIWISPFYDMYRRVISSKAVNAFFRILDRFTFGKLYHRISQRLSRKRISEFYFYRGDIKSFVRDRTEKYKKHVIEPFEKDLKSSSLDSKDSMNLDSRDCILLGLALKTSSARLESSPQPTALESTLMTQATYPRYIIIEGHFHLGYFDEGFGGDNICYNTLYSQYFHKKYFVLKRNVIEVANE